MVDAGSAPNPSSVFRSGGPNFSCQVNPGAGPILFLLTSRNSFSSADERLGKVKGFERGPQNFRWRYQTYTRERQKKRRTEREPWALSLTRQITKKPKSELTTFWCSGPQKNMNFVPCAEHSPHLVLDSLPHTTHAPRGDESPGVDIRIERS